MKKIYLILICISLLSISNIYAVQIVNNTLTINVSQNSISIYNPYRPTDNNIFSLAYTNVNGTIILNNQTFNFNDLFVNNGSVGVVDFDVTNQLLNCTYQFSNCNTSLTTCYTNTADLGNKTNQLTQCLVNKRDSDNSLSNCNTDKGTLQTQINSSKNNGILYGIGGAGIVSIIWFFLYRSKRGENVKLKGMAEFNPKSAG